MTKNPLINALTATLYIAIITVLINYGPRAIEKTDSPLVPVAMISLFTLSAAIMGYLFLYQPLGLFLAGDKKTALNLFLKTVGVFAVVTIILFFIVFNDFSSTG